MNFKSTFTFILNSESKKWNFPTSLYFFQFQKTFLFSITYFVYLYLDMVGVFFYFMLIFKEIDNKVFLIR